MLKGVSISLFLAACLALYLAVLMVINPTLPGATSVGESRVAYGITILVMAFVCCVIAGFTWSYASSVSASVAVLVALSLWFAVLVAVCAQLGVANQFPL